MLLLWLMYDFSTYSPEADGTDSTFSIPPSKENGYPVVTNKQKALNFIPVDLFNRFFGESFLTDMPPHAFVSMCRNLRVLNAVRDYMVGIPLTYGQYTLS